MRIVLASLCFIAFASPVAAQTGATPDALTQVYNCASQTDNAARLACYDAAVGRLQSEQTSGNIVAVDRGQIETIERESFGFSLPSLPNVFRRSGAAETPTLTETALTIERISRRGDGGAVFYMTNGQAWTQIDTTHARGVRAGDNVTVRRAAMGSFLMVPEDGAPVRVRRSE